MIHRPDDQRKRRGKAAPEERIGRHRRRGIQLEGVDNVVETSLEDGKVSYAEHDEADAGNHPVYVGARRPANDKVGSGEEERPQHHREQAPFRHRSVASCVVNLVVQDLVVDVDAQAKDGTDEDAQEGQGGCDGFPAADLAKDDGDGAELHVQNAVAETEVDGHEKADGRTEHLNRSDQEFAYEFLHADVPLLELGMQCPVARLNPQAARLVDEELRWIRFVGEQDA